MDRRQEEFRRDAPLLLQHAGHTSEQALSRLHKAQSAYNRGFSLYVAAEQ